jgi:hypothetical protein
LLPRGGPEGLNVQAHSEHAQASMRAVLIHIIRLIKVFLDCYFPLLHEQFLFMVKIN